MLNVSHITNRLLLGAAPMYANDYADLRAMGVTHLVDCRDETVFGDSFENHHLMAQEAGLWRHHAPFFDGNPDYDPSVPRSLEELAAVNAPRADTKTALAIHQAVEKVLEILVESPRAKVLVLCAGGISRSPTVVCGVLVRFGFSLAGALAFVRKRRGVYPHQYLWGTLECLMGSDEERIVL